MEGLSVITATGGRQQSFALAERMMARQTFTRTVQWIVVDDCEEPTRCMLGQEYIHATPYWKPGQNTLARNLLLGLERVRFPRVVLWEDDDWYASQWLETCYDRLERADLVAERQSLYYHVPNRTYRMFTNPEHGSMFQTALRPAARLALEVLCRESQRVTDGSYLLDVRLWKLFQRRFPNHKTERADHSGLAVGMKGLPGRKGTGMGHLGRGQDWTEDPGGLKLVDLVGEDAFWYLGTLPNPSFYPPGRAYNRLPGPG